MQMRLDGHRGGGELRQACSGGDDEYSGGRKAPVPAFQFFHELPSFLIEINLPRRAAVPAGFCFWYSTAEGRGQYGQESLKKA